MFVPTTAPMRPVLRVLLLALVVILTLPALAAARFDPLGFRFASPVYFAHSRDGVAMITVTRLNTAPEAQIRYVTTPATAIVGGDYTSVKGELDFAAGQVSATFSVPLADPGIDELPRTVNLGLFGASPIGLGAPDHAVLTILYDDPVSIIRNPLNPLGLPVAPPPGDPLTGAVPFVDHHWGLAAIEARQLAPQKPSIASALDVIAREPEVHRFGNWTTDPTADVGDYLARAAAEGPGTIPEFSTYYLVDTHLMHGRCGSISDPAWRPAAYHRWIEQLAQGVGQHRAIMFLEMDSIITTGCFSPHGLAVRLAELHDAIDILSKLPRLVVYVDAGAADALSASTTAGLLRRAGVSEIQGFFLNSTHYDWTSREIAYGEQISRMTGGKHFVVSTSVNGRGPLVPRDRVHQGNEVLCNPPGRGLGPLPTFHTGFPNVDAFAWIGNPGKSGGSCVPGAPPVGVFWPEYAAALVRNADFRVR